MSKRFLYIAMMVICSLSAKAQTMADADAMYKQFMLMRADTSFTKEQIYVKALECTRAYKAILTATPSGADGFDKCKSVLTSLYPFLKGGAGHSSQEHKDSLAMVFAKTAIGVAMMKEMQNEGLRKDNYYPQLVYFVAARTYNAEQYDDAIVYLKEYMDVTDVSQHPRVLQFLKEAEAIVSQRKKSEEEFVDIYKGVPDFDVFAKASIEKSMNEWKVKDPYETIEEYKLRVNAADQALRCREPVVPYRNPLWRHRTACAPRK